MSDTSQAPRFRLSPTWTAAVAVAAACALAFSGIGADKLWDDEANTAVFARNLLATGELTAWDGKNVIGFRDGGELDENLKNVFMPPLQYWLAAGGLALFGGDEVGLRAPFVLAGLACLVALAFLARRLPGAGLTWSVAVWIAALSPAFLLYMRNCRYYAPGSALAIGVLALAVGPIGSRRALAFRALGAAVCGALLMLTNYFNAVAALAALPLLALLPAQRTRRHVFVSAAAFVASGAVGAYVLATTNPFDAPVPRPDEAVGIARLATLLWWNLRDLGTFEFLPVTLMPVLVLPFLFRRLAGLRPAARAGLVAIGMILIALMTTAAFSPQSVSRSTIADMRYLVPLIPLGAIATAVALRILWGLARPLAAVIACVVVFSNVLHLGFLGEYNGWLPPKGIQCTLCQYVEEVATDRTTTTEALIDYIEKLPKEEVLLVFPAYMGFSAMYYLPDREFCCQLRADHPLTPALRAELPEYVFWEKAKASMALISAPRPYLPEGPLSISGVDMGHFKYVEMLDIPPRDCSRPEIPWHAFPGEDIRALHYNKFFVVTVTR
ncbi:MAG: glycosyltransferase family 39 protein [Proteobacteria bacterium]|nr:glycosyltransferase family 39 protein [Pseudomonadota bacterium]